MVDVFLICLMDDENFVCLKILNYRFVLLDCKSIALTSTIRSIDSSSIV